MAQNSKENSLKSQQERIIEKAMRTNGFLFPETVEEVKEFEKIYGTTDITLPDELQDLSFMEKPAKEPVVRLIGETKKRLALAARGGTVKLTDEVKKQMALDRRKADENSRSKDNGTKLK